MHRTALFAFALVAAALVVVPTAAAGPVGCGCDPIVLLLVVQVVVATVVNCAEAEATHLADGSPACFGITPALSCGIDDAKREAELGEGCAG